jgi:hypothetical protein
VKRAAKAARGEGRGQVVTEGGGLRIGAGRARGRDPGGGAGACGPGPPAKARLRRSAQRAAQLMKQLTGVSPNRIQEWLPLLFFEYLQSKF